VPAPPARDAASRVRVELLTMGPGVDLFTRFGHAALRVHGPDQDVVYNFGYTHFDAPGLVLGFLRGKVVFWVARRKFTTTVLDYREDDRDLYLQELGLRDEEQAELARLLAWTAEPAHRYYVYDHFRDNCATRPRDLIDRVTGGRLRRALGGKPAGTTLRDLVREGFAGELPVLLTAELVLGREVDRPLDLWAACFLPRFLREALRRVHAPGGRPLAGAPLAGAPLPLHLRRAPSPLSGDPRAGARVLWLVAGATLILLGLVALLCRGRRRVAGLLLLPPVLLVGLAGLLIWTLAVGTALPELRWNEHLLVLWPTDLVLVGVVVRWLRGRWFAGRWLRAYAWARLAVALAVLLGHLAGLALQPLPWPLMGLALGAGLVLCSRVLPARRAVVQPAAAPAQRSLEG